MRDGQRVYPVKYLVLHHSVGPEFVNASDITVQDWYDNVGKTRGYKGYTHSYHEHPSRSGKETFAQAHYTLREFNADGNRYGWRLTPLMNDALNNVAWHAGNWSINQQSFGIEICGNYSEKYLPEKALWLLADYFRAHDRSLNGALELLCHKEIMATSCPGKICEQKNEIIRLINQQYSMTQIEDLYNQAQSQVNAKNNEVQTWKNKVTSLETTIQSLNKQTEALKNQGATNKCLAQEEEIKNLKAQISNLNVELNKAKADASAVKSKTNPSTYNGAKILEPIIEGIKGFFRNKSK